MVTWAKPNSVIALLSPTLQWLLQLSRWTTAQTNLTPKKRSRARVTIGGHCVLLQNSLKIFFFKFVLQSQTYQMNHIFPEILLTPEKKIVKNKETRPQSSKNALKWIKIY